MGSRSQVAEGRLAQLSSRTASASCPSGRDRRSPSAAIRFAPHEITHGHRVRAVAARKGADVALLTLALDRPHANPCYRWSSDRTKIPGALPGRRMPEQVRPSQGCLIDGLNQRTNAVCDELLLARAIHQERSALVGTVASG